MQTHRSHAIAALLAVGVTAVAMGQPAPAFEVASIKPNTSGEFNARFGGEPGGLLIVRNNDLRNIIRNTYQVQSYQIVGGPDWLTTERWDITARAGTNATPPQMLEMMKMLLAGRFKLTVRHEEREMPIYALVTARQDRRLGPQLRPATVDCRAVLAAAGERGVAPQLPSQPAGRPSCGTRTAPGLISATGVTMADLVRNLANPAGRAVVDRTGLTGNWDLDLHYVPEVPAGVQLPPGVTIPTDGASLFAALPEQLGLKLEPERMPMPVLVIVSAERATPD